MQRTTVTDDGGWCWFQDPRAVRHEGAHDRTYLGWITRHGDVEVGQFDHGERAVATTTLRTDYERDDHDSPALAVRPDGRLLVFYTRHGGPAVNYRISAAPEDVAEFAPERRLEPGGPGRSVTYPNPRWIDGDLHLFLRNVEDGLGTVVCLVSDDDGETWGPQRELVTTGGEGWCVYSKLSRSRSGEVHLGLTHAMGGSNDPHRSVRHARFDGAALRASDGTVLGRLDDSLPVAVGETTTVFDSDEEGDDAWVWDCAAPDGRPRLAYAQLVSETDHRYRYARWDGGAWRDELLCHGGQHVVPGEDDPETYYSGGVVLDHDRPGVCYASVGSHDSSALLRFERADGDVGWNGDEDRDDNRDGDDDGDRDENRDDDRDGEEDEDRDGTPGWTVRRVVDADVQNVRPVVPWNGHPDLRVCWLRGEYTHYAPDFAEDDGAAYRTAVVGDRVG